MKNKHHLLATLALLAGLFGFFACNKNINDQTTTGLPSDQTVTASVQGRVLDETGLPVKDAAVTSGTSSTTTDVNGVFSFSNISMSSRFGFVKVAKQGYFTGSRSIITDAGSSNYVTINLIPRTAKGSFSSAGGGGVVVQTGDTVVFDAGAIVTASSNASYSGTVHVYAAYLDPTDADLSKHMPGDLRGIGTDGKETALQTFGMMVVELEGDGGEKLQIATGKTASITMTIPDALSKTAPATIPLWYFNDTTGKWIQQGSATRKGNTYCGTTSHFTWWNCDFAMGTVTCKLKLVDQHGNALANANLQISSVLYGTTYAITDANGVSQGLIPTGQALVLKVLNACGSPILTKNIDAASADIDLGTLTATVSQANLVLSGTVVDCSANPVKSGFVNVSLEGLDYRALVTNGVFSTTILRCNTSDAEADLTAGDYGTLQQGTMTKLTVDTGKVNTGQLSACGTAFDQYINLTIGNNNYNLTVPSDSLYFYHYNTGGDVAQIGGVTPAGTSPFESLSFSMANFTATGSYNTQWFTYYIGSGGYTQASNGSVQVSVTNYPEVGDYLQGTLSGTVKDTTYTNTPVNTYNLTGSFKVKRLQ